VSRMARSSLAPALSRMSGECTRPSVPMMKLTLTRVLGSAISSNGFGVAKGSGGAEASQSVVAAACSMAANFESRSGETHTWRSRAANVNDPGPAETRSSGPMAEARQLAEAKATRTSEHNLRTGISNSQEYGGSYSRHTLNPSQRAIRMPARMRVIYLIIRDLIVGESAIEAAEVKTIAVLSVGSGLIPCGRSRGDSRESLTTSPGRSEPDRPPSLATYSSVALGSMCGRVA
jgi:hypothetical protein